VYVYVGVGMGGWVGGRGGGGGWAGVGASVRGKSRILPYITYYIKCLYKQDIAHL
jgi:hypothetical protein